MKKKSLIKSISLLTISVFSLTYLFLIPLTKISVTYAQDVPQINPPSQKTVSRLYIPTNAGGTIVKTNTGEQALILQDHLASTRIIDKGSTQETQQYYGYGETIGDAQTTTDKQFTSHRNLTDAGVYHAGARFYNPQLGIFVSADKVQGPNRYMYGMGNPALYTDPSGNIVPLIIAAVIIGGASFGAGFGVGYEHSSQVAQYGSVQDPAAVVGAGIAGGAAGAGIGYMGAVAVPAAISAVGAGAGAAGSVGIIGGAQIAAQRCMTGACIDAVETAASLATGADLPMGYRSSGDVVDQAGLGLARRMNSIWVTQVDPPSSGLDPRYFTQSGDPTDALMAIRTKLLGQIGDHVNPNDINGIYVVGSNRSGDVNPNSDIDILVYTRATYFDRGSEETYSPRAINLQRAMNPQIQSDEDWMNFTLAYKGLPSTIQKRDLVDMFVSPRLGPSKRPGAAQVFDLLNNRWGEMIYPSERTIVIPRVKK